MQLGLLIYLLAFVAPISILLHEVGHAMAAWFVKADHIYIFIGTGSKEKTFKAGRLHISIAPFFFVGGLAVSERKKSYSWIEKLFITISGPISSGIVVFVFWMISQFFATPFIQLFVLFNTWIAIVNLIPIQLKSKQTDGYVMLKLLYRAIKN